MIGPAESEARFSPPGGWCRHPEWWTSTDDHSTEIEVSALIAGLVRGTQPGLCIETGSAWGQTAEAIGQALHANGHGRLVSLETDPERVAYSKGRVAGLPVDVLEMSSLDYESDAPVDLLFSDSLFPLRLPEFHRFSPHMPAGAVVVFHDTRPGAGGGQVGDFHGLSAQIATELSHLAWLNLRTPRGVMIGQIR